MSVDDECPQQKRNIIFDILLMDCQIFIATCFIFLLLPFKNSYKSEPSHLIKLLRFF